jgi:YVTN family beta-propeller protein
MGCSSISVRGLAAIAALFALFCLGTASAGAAPLVWMANSNGESVSTFDSTTNSEAGSPIKVGKRPISIAITPNGKRAVVVNFEGGSATVIETASRKPVNTVSLGHNGERVAISPDGKSAYVTAESDDEVQVVNPETAKGVGSITVGPEASAVAFSPDGDVAYVGTAPKDIAVVNTATEEVVGKPIEVGGFPKGIVFTPDGEKAYVIASGTEEVSVVDPALGEVVGHLLMTGEPTDLAMSPDGQQLWVSSKGGESVTEFPAAGDDITGTPIKVGKEPGEIAFTPSGRTAYVAITGEGVVKPLNTATRSLGTPIQMTGKGVSALVVAPDQSPTAAFTAPSATVGTPAAFSGAASTDPDGSVVSWSWGFGDGGVGSGVSVTHTYAAPGTYSAKLSVVDNEGCGEAEVFTGRTAYCSGAAPAVHAVTAKAPAVEPIATVAPSNKFRFGSLIHNRRNGTARLQVKLPSAGFVLLFGKKVHAVTRKSKGVQSMWLTIHARVELNKRLKTILRAPVKIRVSFTPNGGTPKTLHRTVSLVRAPRHAHRGH